MRRNRGEDRTPHQRRFDGDDTSADDTPGERALSAMAEAARRAARSSHSDIVMPDVEDLATEGLRPAVRIVEPDARPTARPAPPAEPRSAGPIPGRARQVPDQRAAQPPEVLAPATGSTVPAAPAGGELQAGEWPTEAVSLTEHAAGVPPPVAERPVQPVGEPTRLVDVVLSADEHQRPPNASGHQRPRAEQRPSPPAVADQIGRPAMAEPQSTGLAPTGPDLADPGPTSPDLADPGPTGPAWQGPDPTGPVAARGRADATEPALPGAPSTRRGSLGAGAPAAAARHRTGGSRSRPAPRLLMPVLVAGAALVVAGVALAVVGTHHSAGTTPAAGRQPVPVVPQQPGTATASSTAPRSSAGSAARSTPRSSPASGGSSGSEGSLPGSSGSGSSGGKSGASVPAAAAPVISGISPANGAPGSEVTITGQGFVSANGTILASFGGVVAVTRCPDPSTCIASVPAPSGGNAPTGPVPVTITTASGTSAPVAFTYG